MNEIKELSTLLSSENGAILDLLLSLKRKHESLLQIYEDAINKINGGVYAKNSGRN